ncbi:CheY-like chemotaxis protein [Paraburkholderia strydomiana]|nr:CheY-like chemotaxis protein [Paraburkholderia strydomiana]
MPASDLFAGSRSAGCDGGSKFKAVNDPRTLVVDDEVASTDATCELLMLIRMRPQPAEGAAQALNTLDGADVDVVFTGVVMPDVSPNWRDARLPSVRRGRGVRLRG